MEQQYQSIRWPHVVSLHPISKDTHKCKTNNAGNENKTIEQVEVSKDGILHVLRRSPKGGSEETWPDGP